MTSLTWKWSNSVNSKRTWKRSAQPKLLNLSLMSLNSKSKCRALTYPSSWRLNPSQILYSLRHSYHCQQRLMSSITQDRCPNDWSATNSDSNKCWSTWRKTLSNSLAENLSRSLPILTTKASSFASRLKIRVKAWLLTKFKSCLRCLLPLSQIVMVPRSSI